MKQRYIRSAFVFMMALAVMFCVAGCGTSTVDVTEATYKDMPVQIHNDANVTALNKATVTPAVTGPVTYNVKVGDAVTAGQVLATVDTTALEAQLSSLEASLAQARDYAPAVETTTAAVVDSGQLEQAKRMREAGMITQKEYDRIAQRSQPQTTVSGGGASDAANTAVIEAQIAQVSAQIAGAQITAPIDGIVTAVYNEDRQMALADRPFMLIQQMSPMVASLSIPRDAAMKLASPEAKQGMKVVLKVDGQEVPGELTYVDTNQPESVPSVLVKATFNNPSGIIKPGEFYNLVIESSAQAKMLVVPGAAVRENTDGKFVYVVTENNTVDVRVVEVGDTKDGDTAIISGLNEGDKVITTDGTFELGESVSIK